jgi:hypothetical protein
MGIPTTVEVTVTHITPAVTAIRPTAGGMGIPTTAEVTATPITACLRITAGRMVITGSLMPTATRAIAITGLTTSQAIGVTRITGGKTIANMATGRTGSMRTGAAFIRDAASGIARRNVDTTGNRASLPRNKHDPEGPPPLPFCMRCVCSGKASLLCEHMADCAIFRHPTL